MNAPKTKRKLVGHEDCRCIFTQYCDGKCRPIFADVPVPDAPHHRSADTEGTGLMSPDGVSPAPAPDLAALLDEAHRALTQLAEYADGFSVSGVYLNETADGKQAIADAFAAISRIDAVRKEKP